RAGADGTRVDGGVEPRVLRGGGRLRAGRRGYDLPGGDPAEDPVDDPDDADDHKQRRLERVAEDQPDDADEHREEEEQPERPPAVGADLLLEGHAGAKLTCTGSRSSVPKNSRSRKPNGRATSTAGNVCCTVLKR